MGKIPIDTPEINPGTVRPVAQCLNHYATPGPLHKAVGLVISVKMNIIDRCFQKQVGIKARSGQDTEI